jgi:hypothetical protein
MRLQMIKKLSPAAYAVWNAFLDRYEWEVTTEELFAVAAVLRAAAEIVAPLSYEDVWTDGRMLQYEKDDPVRNKLLAIADELETQ